MQQYMHVESVLSEQTHSLRISLSESLSFYLTRYDDKSWSNMKIFYLIWKLRWYIKKQQVNKQQRAFSQSGRQHMMRMFTKQCLMLNSITR